MSISDFYLERKRKKKETKDTKNIIFNAASIILFK